MPRQQHEEVSHRGGYQSSPREGGSSECQPRAEKAMFNGLERLRIIQTVNREWRPHLTLMERDLLFYLLDRTVSWGTDSVRTTMEELVNGSSRVPPTGLSRATIFRAMKSLQDHGILASSIHNGVYLFTLNVSWEPDVSSQKNKELKNKGSVSHSSDPVMCTQTDETEHQSDAVPSVEPVSDWHRSSLNLTPLQSQFDTPYNSTPSTVKNSKTPNPLSGVGGEGGGDLLPSDAGHVLSQQRHRSSTLWGQSR